MAIEIAQNILIGVNYFLRIISTALVIYCIMSWVVRPTNSFFIFLSRLVAPILAPFRPISRKLIERGFMIDISVFLAFIVIQIIQRYLPILVFRLMGIL